LDALCKWLQMREPVAVSHCVGGCISLPVIPLAERRLFREIRGPRPSNPFGEPAMGRH